METVRALCKATCYKDILYREGLEYDLPADFDMARHFTALQGSFVGKGSAPPPRPVQAPQLTGFKK